MFRQYYVVSKNMIYLAMQLILLGLQQVEIFTFTDCGKTLPFDSRVHPLQ